MLSIFFKNLANRSGVITGALVVYQVAEEFGAPPISNVVTPITNTLISIDSNHESQMDVFVENSHSGTNIQNELSIVQVSSNQNDSSNIEIPTNMTQSSSSASSKLIRVNSDQDLKWQDWDKLLSSQGLSGNHNKLILPDIFNDDLPNSLNQRLDSNSFSTNSSCDNTVLIPENKQLYSLNKAEIISSNLKQIVLSKLDISHLSQHESITREMILSHPINYDNNPTAIKETILQTNTVLYLTTLLKDGDITSINFCKNNLFILEEYLNHNSMNLRIEDQRIINYYIHQKKYELCPTTQYYIDPNTIDLSPNKNKTKIIDSSISPTDPTDTACFDTNYPLNPMDNTQFLTDKNVTSYIMDRNTDNAVSLYSDTDNSNRPKELISVGKSNVSEITIQEALVNERIQLNNLGYLQIQDLSNKYKSSLAKYNDSIQYAMSDDDLYLQKRRLQQELDILQNSPQYKLEILENTINQLNNDKEILNQQIVTNLQTLNNEFNSNIHFIKRVYQEYLLKIDIFREKALVLINDIKNSQFYSKYTAIAIFTGISAYILYNNPQIILNFAKKIYQFTTKTIVEIKKETPTAIVENSKDTIIQPTIDIVKDAAHTVTNTSTNIAKDAIKNTIPIDNEIPPIDYKAKFEKITQILLKSKLRKP